MGLQLVGVTLTLVLSAVYLYWQNQNPERWAAKRPVLALILVWFAVFAVAVVATPGTPFHAIIWSVVGVSISSLWILAYSASDQKTKDSTPTSHRAVFLRPFWGGGAAPIGKSFGYLNKCKANTDEELA